MSDDDLQHTFIEVAHWFEIDLSILVIQNHQLVIEGIGNQERNAIAKTCETLEHEDAETIDSQIRWQENIFEDMRNAARQLAAVGLVTRFDYWITKFVDRVPDVHKSSWKGCRLCKNLDSLNRCVGTGPVPLQFFEDLISTRDSVIHGGSKAEWKDERYGTVRKIAERYRNGTELEITEDQLNEAAKNLIAQVEWYDERPASRGIRSWRSN